MCSEKSGRRKTGRSQENIEENPVTTSRVNGLGLSKSTFQRIVSIDLGSILIVCKNATN